MRRVLAGVLAILSSVGLGGCGTIVFTSTWRVSVDDPAALLPPGEVRISVFDVARGDTRDWAVKHLGSATSAEPLVVEIGMVETRTAWDGGPPKRLRAGLYLPDYREHAWYSVEFEPEAGTEQRVEARAIAFDGYGLMAAGAAPLSLRVHAEKSGKAWDLTLVVELADARPNESQAPPSQDAVTLALIQAAEKGDQPEAERLLLKGAQINGANAEGTTPVLAAVRAGHLELARMLLQRGADPNLQDAAGENAYLAAASRPGPGDALLVALLNGGAKAGARDSAGDTALIRAARMAESGAIRRLLTFGEAVNAANKAGRTALHEAFAAGGCTPARVEVVQLLVSAGADVNLPDKTSGNKPLQFARAANCEAAAAILTAAGATAN